MLKNFKLRLRTLGIINWQTLVRKNVGVQRFEWKIFLPFYKPGWKLTRWIEMLKWDWIKVSNAFFKYYESLIILIWNWCSNFERKRKTENGTKHLEIRDHKPLEYFSCTGGLPVNITKYKGSEITDHSVMTKQRKTRQAFGLRKRARF